MPLQLVVAMSGTTGCVEIVKSVKASECKHAIIRLHCATSKSSLWYMGYVPCGSAFESPRIYRKSRIVHIYIYQPLTTTRRGLTWQMTECDSEVVLFPLVQLSLALLRATTYVGERACFPLVIKTAQIRYRAKYTCTLIM